MEAHTMEKYNYLKEETNDVIVYIFENYTKEDIKEKLQDMDAFAEALNDALWIEDAVTGNASGSYTFNRWRAEEYIAHNLDLLKDAFIDFCVDFSDALERGAEYCDVTIRCYLLSEAIDGALLALSEDLKDGCL
jgi:hypothetical protein